MQKQELFGGCRVVNSNSNDYPEGYRLEMDNKNIYIRMYKKIFSKDEFVTIFKCQLDSSIFYKESGKFRTPEELIKKIIRLTRHNITKIDVDSTVIDEYKNQIEVNV